MLQGMTAQIPLFQQLMDSAEAAVELGVSKITVQRWAHDGLMVPAHTSGGTRPRYIFTAEEVARARRNIRRRRRKAAA